MLAQYGCGACAPPGWRNFDASPTLRLERIPLLGRFYRRRRLFQPNVEYGDIVFGLPVPADSCEAVYASHVLEHLCLTDFRQALKNTFLCLREGGVFRLVMPDLKACARAYLNDPEPDAGIKFILMIGLGVEKRPAGIAEMLSALSGHSRHLWLWDFESTALELAAVGFRDIRRAQFGDSALTCFNVVEEEDRWTGCLGIECVR